MIRLHRGAEPVVLRNAGVAATADLCVRHDADPAAFAATPGSKLFDRDLYGSAEVKDALARDQHHKCAFCEAKITHVTYGDVEHFRPKSAWRQSQAEPLERPGYYWLAYTWDNLLLACQLCNSRHKGNLFPLVDPALRVRHYANDLTLERPGFIHPYQEDPANTLAWHDEVVTARASDVRGRATIGGLGLDRPALEERRRERLAWIRAVHDLLTVLCATPALSSDQLRSIDEARRLLADSTGAGAEYAEMTRAWLAANPPPASPGAAPP